MRDLVLLLAPKRRTSFFGVTHKAFLILLPKLWRSRRLFLTALRLRPPPFAFASMGPDNAGSWRLLFFVSSPIDTAPFPAAAAGEAPYLFLSAGASLAGPFSPPLFPFTFSMLIFRFFSARS